MSDRKLSAIIFGSFVTMLLIIAASCAAPQPRPLTISDAAGYCAPGIGPASPDAACDGRFTADGMACAICAVNHGCVAADLMVYCVHDCADRSCGVGKHRR